MQWTAFSSKGLNETKDSPSLERVLKAHPAAGPSWSQHFSKVKGRAPGLRPVLQSRCVPLSFSQSRRNVR